MLLEYSLLMLFYQSLSLVLFVHVQQERVSKPAATGSLMGPCAKVSGWVGGATRRCRYWFAQSEPVATHHWSIVYIATITIWVESVEMLFLNTIWTTGFSCPNQLVVSNVNLCPTTPEAHKMGFLDAYSQVLELYQGTRIVTLFLFFCSKHFMQTMFGFTDCPKLWWSMLGFGLVHGFLYKNANLLHKLHTCSSLNVCNTNRGFCRINSSSVPIPIRALEATVSATIRAGSNSATIATWRRKEVGTIQLYSCFSHFLK